MGQGIAMFGELTQFQWKLAPGGRLEVLRYDRDEGVLRWTPTALAHFYRDGSHVVGEIFWERTRWEGENHIGHIRAMKADFLRWLMPHWNENTIHKWTQWRK